MIKLLEHTRRPDIVFQRNGCISITAHVARLLALQPGDSINIASHQGEYYLLSCRHATIGRHIAQCFRTNANGMHFRAYSKVLCNFVLRQCGATDVAKLTIGEQVMLSGRPAITLILHNLQNQ